MASCNVEQALFQLGRTRRLAKRKKYRSKNRLRAASNIHGFINGNQTGFIWVNGQWINAGSASDDQILSWWHQYNDDNKADIANGGRGLAFAGAAALTTPQARDLAQYLGFRQVKVDWARGNEPVFEKDGRYISRDIDSHKGRVWKEFTRDGKRVGTLDAFLNKIGN